MMKLKRENPHSMASLTPISSLPSVWCFYDGKNLSILLWSYWISQNITWSSWTRKYTGQVVLIVVMLMFCWWPKWWKMKTENPSIHQFMMELMKTKNHPSMGSPTPIFSLPSVWCVYDGKRESSQSNYGGIDENWKKENPPNYDDNYQSYRYGKNTAGRSAMASPAPSSSLPSVWCAISDSLSNRI